MLTNIAAFRLTSVFPPAPHPLANEGSKIRLEKHTPICIQPLEVMIQARLTAYTCLSVILFRRH